MTRHSPGTRIGLGGALSIEQLGSIPDATPDAWRLAPRRLLAHALTQEPTTPSRDLAVFVAQVLGLIETVPRNPAQRHGENGWERDRNRKAARNTTAPAGAQARDPEGRYITQETP